jgi:hypothetical protein
VIAAVFAHIFYLGEGRKEGWVSAALSGQCSAVAAVDFVNYIMVYYVSQLL